PPGIDPTTNLLAAGHNHPPLHSRILPTALTTSPTCNPPSPLVSRRPKFSCTSGWPTTSPFVNPPPTSAPAVPNIPTRSKPVDTGFEPAARWSSRGSTTSKYPSIISSHDWSPHRTVADGSGFARFSSELSNTARQ